jgi:hypothetical protein
MTVPEAAMHEDYFLTRRKNQIWLARKICAMQPISKSAAMDQTTHEQFRFGVSVPD